jgi:nitroreductase
LHFGLFVLSFTVFLDNLFDLHKEMFKDLIIRNRSYRRFLQEKEVPLEVLRELVDLARLTPSASNLQPLKYIISCKASSNNRIFETLAWAGYITEWSGPVEGERPAAYIIILWDQSISQKLDCDHGIVAQSIMLGAVEKQLGGCIIGSIQRDKLGKILKIPDQYKIMLVLALGYPKENVKIEPLPESRSIHYWRDEKQVHHVPKRDLKDLILKVY